PGGCARFPGSRAAAAGGDRAAYPAGDAGMSVVEAARRVREREISPSELVESYLERIEQVNGALNAYISVRAEEALADADQAREGPLRGVPVAVKDVIDVAGSPT